MELLRDISQFDALLSDVKAHNKRYHTNYFLLADKLQNMITEYKIFIQQLDNGFILYKREDTYFRLYYFFYNLKELNFTKADLPVVIDIIKKDSDSTEIDDLWMDCGFHKYAKYKRMAVASKDINIPFCERENFSLIASQSDTDSIYGILTNNFDIFSDHIPKVEEVFQAITDKNVILEKNISGNITGFLFFELMGISSLIRYIFVDPKFRGQGISRQLMAKYFQLTCQNVVNHLLWVDEKNYIAQKLYISYGYKFDNLIDNILIYGKKE